MSEPGKVKLPAIDRAFRALRSEQPKPDAVFVCKMWLKDDGTWETDSCFRHWIRQLESDDPKGLPKGVPGAIIAALTSRPLHKQLGRILNSVATSVLAPRVGDEAAQVVGNIIDNFTQKE